MSFRRSKQLKHYYLPIAGHTLLNITCEPRLKLIFSAPDGLLSELILDWQTILTRADGSSIIVPWFMGDNCDAIYEEFAFLLGEAVTSSIAHDSGQLEINFYEGTKLEVYPDNYEAWHFYQPAQGSDYPKDSIQLTGYEGGLIGFGPVSQLGRPR
jgi:hypothetical protein